MKFIKEKSKRKPFIEIKLSDTKFFDLAIGKRVLKKQVYQKRGKIPIYSANVNEVFGYTNKSNILSFDTPYVLWGIDSYFEFNIIPSGTKFATTDHCGTIKIKNTEIIPEYINYQLNKIKTSSFDREWRPSLKNMGKKSVSIPVLENSKSNSKEINFDVETQKQIAKKFTLLKKVKEKLQLLREEMKELEDTADAVILE